MRLTKINHFSHQHPLILNDPQEPYQCDGCKQLGFGLRYECDQQGCNFCLHDECANATSSAYHPLLKDCSLSFHVKPPQNGARYCDACGKDILGFVYQCNHKNPYDLHPCCVKLQLKLEEDGVMIKLKEKLPSKCLKCGSKEIAKGVKGWSYVSSGGNYCYHVACMKEMMVESWKRQRGKKMEETATTTMRTTGRMDLQRISRSQEVAKQSESSSKGRKLWSMTKTVIMLIISAIFGDPTSLIIALAQQVFSA